MLAMNHRFGIPGLLILFVLGSGAPAVRAQDGLYAPSVPTDAALVRVVNLQTSKPAPRVDIGPLRFARVAAGEVTPYRPAPPGVYVVGGRAAGVEFLPEPGKFYSIVADSDGALTVVEDEAHRDPARAQIVLFNFRDETVSLASVEPAAAIFPAVPPGGSRTIAVNAISVELTVEERGDELFRRRLQLERGESYGIFVGRERVFLEAASVATE
jgi:hypothetical protein